MTPSAFRLAVLILLFSSAQAFCAKILEVRKDADEIVIAHEAERAWIPGDRVCIFRTTTEVACGDVRHVDEKSAVVKLTTRRDRVSKKVIQDSRKGSYIELVFGKDPVKKGDVAEFAGGAGVETGTEIVEDSATKIVIEGLENLNRFREEAPDRQVAMANREDLTIELESRSQDDDDERALHHGNQSNISAGLSFIYPVFHFQQAVLNHFTLGIQPIFVNTTAGNGTVKGLGTYLTFNYYGLEPFHGDWVQLGVGVYELTASANGVDSKYYSPAIQGTVGWRWYWENDINFGFAVGVQYLTNARPSNRSVDFAGLLPIVALDFGYSF